MITPREQGPRPHAHAAPGSSNQVVNPPLHHRPAPLLLFVPSMIQTGLSCPAVVHRCAKSWRYQNLSPTNWRPPRTAGGLTYPSNVTYAQAGAPLWARSKNLMVAPHLKVLPHFK